MEKRMVKGHYHNPLDLNNDFDSTNEPSSPFSTTSCYKPLKLLPLSTPPPLSSSSSSVGVGTSGGGLSYMEHPVSKFDTLAGVAIKYGVEVADIKKLNGLVTDHQMFARTTLQIPLSGRRPPSSMASDSPDSHGPSGSDQTPSKLKESDFFESFKLGASPMRNVSPAMTTRQGYFGVESAEEISHSEGLEMAVYNKGGANYPVDGLFTKAVIPPNVTLNHLRKSKSVAYDLYKSILDNDEDKDDDSEKFESLRSKSEYDLRPKPKEMLLKDVSSGAIFSAHGSKGLALRPKSVARTVSGGATEGGFPTALSDSPKTKTSSGVRRSSSATSLLEAENSTTSSASSWLTSNWSLKPDLQALSTSSITKPIFDGLPKPISGKKSKAAID
ncbi:hypothetical protein LIER_22950 [Lithospermum erythrorhizon]|uniref:LysM domain-containing protein n=1 Tax=Lithospermum erythrorhizon TaxID=34254 RepID=A0AAV3QYQ6_LITER